MVHDDLDDATRAALGAFVRAFEERLDKEASPHLRAASTSWIDEGSTSVNGGAVTSPAAPPLKIRTGEMSALHRTVLEAGGRRIYSVVARAHRPDVESKWKVEPFVLSREEHRALVARREALDQRIEIELRRFGEEREWQALTFARKGAFALETSVTVRSPGAREKLPPSAPLLALLDEVDAIYQDAGLKLITILWSLEAGARTVGDYFE